MCDIEFLADWLVLLFFARAIAILNLATFARSISFGTVVNEEYG